MAATTTHVSPFSGSWYPGDRTSVERLVDELFAGSETRTGPYLAPDPLAFVVPHAGLIYSGRVAAAAYRHVAATKPERIVLLGFPHHGARPGVWIPDLAAIETPLGAYRVDQTTASQLALTKPFGRMPEPDLCDHSVEIQIPLLQHAAPAAELIPVYVSRLDEATRREAAHVLAAYAKPGTVFIASSDFTHYGKAFHYQPFPVDNWVADRIRQLDESVIDEASSLSSDLFLKQLHKTSATVCGREPIALLLELMRLLDGDDEIFQETLDYQTSGELTDDYHHSVSYAALGYFRNSSFRLTEDEKTALLRSAREALDRYLDSGTREPAPCTYPSPGLDRQAGAFVTLHRRGELRGCVGRRGCPEPLRRSIPILTICAATEDSRFDCVASHERDIEIEISVLSPVKRIANLEAFRVNEHGALLECGYHRGLLLPQVATDRNWGSEQFFQALAKKTRMPSNVYEDPDTRVFVFRAQIFP